MSVATRAGGEVGGVGHGEGSELDVAADDVRQSRSDLDDAIEVLE